MVQEFDVVIVGGGVSGTALLHVLSKYTNVKKIALLEKYDKVAQVNSHKDNNSQTLHFGDIETNYTKEKAAVVQKAANLTAAYLQRHSKERLFRKEHKMVLAVGKEEVAALEQRHKDIQSLFPKLRKIHREEIAKLEPKLVEGRDPNIPLLALLSPDGYVVDYGRLSQSFVTHSKRKGVKVFLKTYVNKVIPDEKGFTVETNKGPMRARVVVTAAGSQSLTFAHKLGYGKEWILLPMAGSFFRSKKMVSGKVYMMQLKKLPFAAVHADPDVHDPSETRYGPVSKVLPMMERYKYASVFEFFKLFRFRPRAIWSLFHILKEPAYRRYVQRQVIYDLPYFGTLFFVREVRKIIPSMRASDLHFARGIGGIRPQIVDTKSGTVYFGEAKILGDKIIFDITPSPGASVCLQNAQENVTHIMKFLGDAKFDAARLHKDLTLTST